MNRNELIDAIALDLGMSHNQVRKVVNAALDRILDAVIEGDRVTLKGFGTFRRTWLPPRHARHPESHRLTELQPRFTCRFKASENVHRRLKDFIGEGNGAVEEHDDDLTISPEPHLPTAPRATAQA